MKRRTKRSCAKVRAPKPTPLLACPFCGSQASVGIWVMSSYWSIGCSGDFNARCPVSFSNYFETKDKAIAFWNTRYQP